MYIEGREFYFWKKILCVSIFESFTGDIQGSQHHGCSHIRSLNPKFCVNELCTSTCMCIVNSFIDFCVINIVRSDNKSYNW